MICHVSCASGILAASDFRAALGSTVSVRIDPTMAGLHVGSKLQSGRTAQVVDGFSGSCLGVLMLSRVRAPLHNPPETEASVLRTRLLRC